MAPPASAAKGGKEEPQKDTDRNEYIPSFISKKPFYIDDATASQDDYLEHQRLVGQKKNLDPIATSKWYDRGKSSAPAATKFRKGACENCGAMGHKAKDCLQRKRKLGARWTGKDIQADREGQEVKLGWDAKRDRWNGYDASEYSAVVEEYNALEEMKKQAALKDKPDGEDEEEAKDEGDRYEAETDMGRHQPTSTRGLRLREDTAKYLVNLDLESAEYDPKTRSMVEKNPEGTDADDGFARPAGDDTEFERAQRYAWEGQERGDKNALHLQANPTAGEVSRKKQEKESSERKEARRKALAEKYGGQEHLQKDPLKNAAITENERFVEYDEKGRLKADAERKEKSMYQEDVLINNHTSVWGSWWKEFQWGYACCHSTMKHSYCVGDEGKRAMEESDAMAQGSGELKSIEAPDQSVEVPKDIAQAQEELLETHVPNGVDRPEKVKSDELRGKRRYDEMAGGVSEADMEEYRKRRVDADDPMAKLVAAGGDDER